MFLSLNVPSAPPPLTLLSSACLILPASTYLHTADTPCSPGISLAPFVVSPQTFSLRWCQDRLNSFCIMFTQGDTGLNVFLLCRGGTRLDMAVLKQIEIVEKRLKWKKIRWECGGETNKFFKIQWDIVFKVQIPYRKYIQIAIWVEEQNGGTTTWSAEIIKKSQKNCVKYEILESFFTLDLLKFLISNKLKHKITLWSKYPTTHVYPEDFQESFRKNTKATGADRSWLLVPVMCQAQKALASLNLKCLVL